MVLGFLAFSVWVSLKSGFIKFLSGGRDVRWGPQTDIQLDAVARAVLKRC